MNIRAVDIVGAGNSDSITAVAPGRTTESAQSSKPQGGNGDVSPVQVKKMVDEMQSHLDSMNVSLQYSLYGEHGKNIAVKVVDKQTGDVVREIPPKEMQALQEKMSELVGMIFNEKG